MQSKKSSPNQQLGFPSWMLDLLKEHYGWMSASITVLASFAGLINLAFYAHYIGRSDVFIPSLELGPGLVLLWLAYILFFVLLIVSMVITSLFLAMGLSVLRPKPAYSASIVRILAGITVLAMVSGVMAPIGIAAIFDVSASLWWTLTVFIPPMLCSLFFMKGNIEKVDSLTGTVTRRKMLSACLALTALVGITALLSVYPAWFVTTFYLQRGALGGTFEGLLFCIIAMIGSLAPTIGYYNLMSKGRAAQVKAAFGGIVVYMSILTMMIPSVLIFPSVAAVKFLGIGDRQVKRYLITNDDYPADSLDAKRWAITRSQEKKFILQGFSPYTYGPIALLCPAELLTFKVTELDAHTAQCIPFNKNAVRALDGVVQKAKLASTSED